MVGQNDSKSKNYKDTIVLYKKSKKAKKQALRIKLQDKNCM